MLWIVVLRTDPYPLSGLCLQPSVLSMKWHCLSRLFSVIFFYCRARSVNTLFKRFVSTSHFSHLLVNFCWHLPVSKTHKFVFLAIHDTRKICLTAFFSNASNLFSSNVFMFQLSQPYVATSHTHTTPCLKKNCANLFFAPCLSNMNRFQ